MLNTLLKSRSISCHGLVGSFLISDLAILFSFAACAKEFNVSIHIFIL